MSKNVQIVKTVKGMSQSLDVIASKVIAGEYTEEELKERLDSVSNVLDTTASAQAHILGQVRDVASFSTVASTTEFDDTLSVVLATQAQATLVGQMIRGELGIVAEDEEEEGTDEVQEAVSFEDEEEGTDEVQEAVSFEDEDEDTSKLDPNSAKTTAEELEERADDLEEQGFATEAKKLRAIASQINKSKSARPVKSGLKKAVKAGTGRAFPSRAEELEEKADELEEQGFATEAKKLRAIANSIGEGENHGEINPQIKVVEKSGANDVTRKSDGNAPMVKTTASETASATAMGSQASQRPMVSWNFN